jgi:microcystin-dependent protein
MSTTPPKYPDPFLGEIRMFAARTISIDVGWHLCDGSILQIAEYEFLFDLIGTTFGGDGQNNFALPDLRGRVPVHLGGSLVLGTMDGVEAITLSQSEMPVHNHTVNSNKGESLTSPAGNFWGVSNSNPYSSPPGTITLNPAAIANYGFGYAHENRIPYQVVNFMIALQGNFPSPDVLVGTPILSELRIFPYDIVPKGWVVCNGKLLQVSQNEALFALLGTTYGGNGTTNFAVPNLNGRVPMHRGLNINTGMNLSVGEMGGEETHTLTLAEIPNHTHQAVASPFNPDRNTPENNFWTLNTGFKPYGSQANNLPMSFAALESVGKNLPHNNMAPFLVFNICMATAGIFPQPDSKDVTSDPWTSEIRILAGNVIPHFWLPCDGQKIPIGSNSELFSLIGTYYGGNGITTVGIPDLKAAAPIMAGQGNGLSEYFLGEVGGAAVVTLTANEIPVHTHAAMANESGNEGEPEGMIWANPGAQIPLPNFYSSTVGTDPQHMNAAAIGNSGGGLPHNNMMPYNVLTYCIATAGTFPPN